MILYYYFSSVLKWRQQQGSSSSSMRRRVTKSVTATLLLLILILRLEPVNSFILNYNRQQKRNGKSVVCFSNHYMKQQQREDDDDDDDILVGIIPRRRQVVHAIFGSTTSFGLALSIQQQQQPASAMTNNPTTGIALPDIGEIENAIPKDWTADVENPFDEENNSNSMATMFGRLDTKPDSIFYEEPRFVEHVDDEAVRIITDYISQRATNTIKPGDSVLDLCSSWTSHLTASSSSELKRVAGLGMNSKELEANKALTDWTVQDLNLNPKLPYEDSSFDVVLCQLSIDYLTRPLEVLREVSRVLKPGGKVHIIFSNRLFLSKAVGLWAGADDIDHVYYVGCYLHFCGGRFDQIVAQDLSKRSKGKNGRIVGDPVYVVTAVKV